MSDTDALLQDAPPDTAILRHIVQHNEGTPEDTTLCGRLWDRLNVEPGPLCKECAAEYRRRRPGWPLPG